jgi:hypothetical protein
MQDQEQTEPESITDQVKRQLDAICFGYVEGLSLSTIGRSLSDRKLTGLQLLRAIENDSALSEIWRTIRAARAEAMLEQAREEADNCEPKDKAAILIKLAEKLAPTKYGATLKHTGADGEGPIKVDVTSMSPADAYRHMLGGNV